MQVDEDVLLTATSWLDLWMGRQVPEHVDAVPDVSGFELRFRNFHRKTSSDCESHKAGEGSNSECTKVTEQ